MEIPDADDLDLRETFTIEAWVKPHNASTSNEGVRRGLSAPAP
jgi:hypothetical protein